MTSLLPTPNHSNPSLCSFYSLLIVRCLSFSCLSSAHCLHGRLLKLGFHCHTFLCNRLLHLYSRIGTLSYVLRAFNDIPYKNIVTWNILLSAFSNAGLMTEARKLFDQMPSRDVVSWNSVFSGYAGIGLLDDAFAALYTMHELGIRGNSYTISIAASIILSPLQAKQVHGTAVRCYFDSSVVVGNSLIKMYARSGQVDYAYSVFQRLENRDSISWNSMISAFGNSGHGYLAFCCFRSMWDSGFFPDEFCISAIIAVCANLKDMAKDWVIPSASSKRGIDGTLQLLIQLHQPLHKVDLSIKLLISLLWLLEGAFSQQSLLLQAF